MKDNNKTREQLLKELAELQKRVAETEKADRDLRESEERYRNITKNASFGISVCNETGQCIVTNKALAKMIGASVEQVISQNFYEIESWKKSGMLDTAKEVLASGEKKRKSFHVLTTFGKDLWLDVTFVPYIEKGEKLLLFLAEDITERKRVERSLKQSVEESQFLAKLLNDSFQPFAAGTPDGRLIKTNPAFCKLTGYTEEGLLNNITWNDTLTPPEYRDDEAEILQTLLSTGKPQRFEKKYIRKDGTRIDVELLVGLKSDDEENLEYIYAFVNDITERKKAEEELQESHDLLEKRVKERTLEISESNAALKVLLNQREQDKGEFEDNILSNIKHLVMPYILQLKRNRSMSDELSYLNIIESNLKEIISPFSQKLSSFYMEFTPKEIQIANLIKDGKQDKDIMEILNISLDTVKTHRKNIRRKLGIYGKRINLRTKLLSITK